MKHCKNQWFLMIFILRVSVESSSNAKEAIKQQSGNQSCIYERLEVDLKGGVEAFWKGRGGLLRRLGGVTKKQKDVRGCEHDAG